jgi:hypothetical protein
MTAAGLFFLRLKGLGLIMLRKTTKTGCGGLKYQATNNILVYKKTANELKKSKFYEKLILFNVYRLMANKTLYEICPEIEYPFWPEEAIPDDLFYQFKDAIRSTQIFIYDPLYFEGMLLYLSKRYTDALICFQKLYDKLLLDIKETLSHYKEGILTYEEWERSDLRENESKNDLQEIIQNLKQKIQ